MTFYDTERIIRKQQKYEKLKAYEAIHKLQTKGLSTEEMISALDILLKDENTEFQQDVLNRAKAILESRKENSDNEKTISYNNLKLNCSDDVCPVIAFGQINK